MYVLWHMVEFTAQLQLPVDRIVRVVDYKDNQATWIGSIAMISHGGGAPVKSSPGQRSALNQHSRESTRMRLVFLRQPLAPQYTPQPPLSHSATMASKELKSLTREEVAKHNKEGDLVSGLVPTLVAIVSELMRHSFAVGHHRLQGLRSLSFCCYASGRSRSSPRRGSWCVGIGFILRYLRLMANGL